MKKLIFLLFVMILGAGMVFAMDNPVHPPGGIAIEAEMFSYGVESYIVTLDTVLVQHQDVLFLLPAGVTALSNGIDSYAVMTISRYVIKPLDTGQVLDYPMRL